MQLNVGIPGRSLDSSKGICLIEGKTEYPKRLLILQKKKL